MIKLGEINISSVKLGDSNISKVYQGETLIFGGSTPIEPVLPSGSEFNFNAKRLQADGLTILNDVDNGSPLTFNKAVTLNNDYIEIDSVSATSPINLGGTYNELNLLMCLNNNNNNVILNIIKTGFKTITLSNASSGAYKGFYYQNNIDTTKNALVYIEYENFDIIQLNATTQFKIVDVTKETESVSPSTVATEVTPEFTMYKFFIDKFDSEYWLGQFKWIYLTYNPLSTDDIQNIINFNSK
jgi:hypothetical protein